MDDGGWQGGVGVEEAGCGLAEECGERGGLFGGEGLLAPPHVQRQRGWQFQFGRELLDGDSVLTKELGETSRSLRGPPCGAEDLKVAGENGAVLVCR